MKKILLHICCAPCVIFPLQILRKEGFWIKGLFFNPNIYPLREYERRLEALKIHTKDTKLEFSSGVYEPEMFLRLIKESPKAPSRCNLCWRLRLRVTAEKAKEEGCEYFTSTLLVSPYQDTSVLEKIAEEEAQNLSLKFFRYDFKSGFSQAHREAKESGLYCQKYCGCIYSLQERNQKK